MKLSRKELARLDKLKAMPPGARMGRPHRQPIPRQPIQGTVRIYETWAFPEGIVLVPLN